MAWELSEAKGFKKNFITVPTQGNKVGMGAGLGKFRRNLVMFKGSILRLCRTQKQPETFKNGSGWGGVWRTTRTKQIKGQKESKE